MAENADVCRIPAAYAAPAISRGVCAHCETGTGRKRGAREGGRSGGGEGELEGCREL